MIKKILKISVLMLALLPTLVFAKDLDNQDIEVGMYFKSGDVIKKPNKRYIISWL